jgi:hypothetical protein
VNVFTGTNTFTASKFFPANAIGVRKIFTTNNIFLSSVPAYTATTPTNAGDSALITRVFKAAMPALLSTNSRIFFSWTVERTNVNAANCNLYWYAGANTNFVLGANNIVPTTASRNSVFNAGVIFQNYNSFGDQTQGGQAASPFISGTANFADTSVAWDLHLALQTSTTATNILIRAISIFEAVE